MSALQRGFGYALLAAIAFGATTPLIALLGSGTGPWSTAGWLYLGSALFAAAVKWEPVALARGFRRNALLLIAIAVIGGMLAPAAYVIGLRDAGPFFASLTLNMEAPFSVAIAVLIFREHVSRRAIVAMFAIVVGSSILSAGGNAQGRFHAGVLFVVLATALWALDNALSSRLRDLDSRITVFWKSAIGAALSLSAGALLHEDLGSVGTVLALILIGGVGYGASLMLYLRAQQTFGIARTASVFALAPFIGAAGAVAIGRTPPSPAGIAAFVAMALGAFLHVTERHAHRHHHHAQTHTHPHRHDDAHHDHTHEFPVIGEHVHPHVHAELEHTHEHAPDREHSHPH